jgi:hypothetical protein
VYYKNDIQANTQFGYNYSINKLIFLQLYYRAKNLAFTTENIQKAWKKSGLKLFCPSLVIGTLEPVLFPELPAILFNSNSVSRLTT